MINAEFKYRLRLDDIWKMSYKLKPFGKFIMEWLIFVNIFGREQRIRIFTTPSLSTKRH